MQESTQKKEDEEYLQWQASLSDEVWKEWSEKSGLCRRIEAGRVAYDIEMKDSDPLTIYEDEPLLHPNVFHQLLP